MLLRILSLACVFALALPLAAAAVPSCHCFQERSYDPANPRAVEPYLLATCHNSLLAVAFGAPKRSIVQQRMGGTSGTDLWLAHAFAPAFRQAPDDLLELRRRHASWASLAAALPFDPERLPAALVAELSTGRDDEQLADRVVAHLLDRDYAIPLQASLPQLRAGLSRKELLLAAYLALQRGSPLEATLEAAHAGPGWGALAMASDIDPSGFEAGWARLRRAVD